MKSSVWNSKKLVGFYKHLLQSLVKAIEVLQMLLKELLLIYVPPNTVNGRPTTLGTFNSFWTFCFDFVVESKDDLLLSICDYADALVHVINEFQFHYRMHHLSTNLDKSLPREKLEIIKFPYLAILVFQVLAAKAIEEFEKLLSDMQDWFQDLIKLAVKINTKIFQNSTNIYQE